ncbi:MAG: hypothetical protein COW42_13925 [Deltaproteobacteria bacterium CG17_big_fil_post_rev_8_21_14_2_50_63_7]|nr:MAG: hypothetical protein COW42_13925 [Deltaproteobacteria bacterium CG17_big_fil_post_rev_8_21_14_2_50_63_7]
MTTAQITSAGLTIKRLTDLRADLRAAVRASGQFGAKASTGSSSVLGQLLDIFAAALAACYELAEQVYATIDPDAAEGVTLDNLCGWNGVTRKPATPSDGTVTCTGTAGTVIPAGKRVRVGDDGALFATTVDATIGGGGSVSVDVQSVDTGAIEAAATAIDTIVDAVAGWTGVSNAADIVPGTELETDVELRDRRERSLAASGSGSDQAIRAAVEAVADVEAAVCVSNRLLTTDPLGIPGKSFRVYVWPDAGLDGVAIARAIYENMPAGIWADGTQVYGVTDDQGYEQLLAFEFATQRLVYLELDIVTGPDFDGDETTIEDAILEYGSTLAVGDSVLPAQIVCHVVAAVPGVEAVTVRLAFDAWPTTETDPLDVAAYEIAAFDVARISLAVT